MTNPQTPQDIVHYRLTPLLGEDYSVFHELVSDELHIDVYCWAPPSSVNSGRCAPRG